MPEKKLKFCVCLFIIIFVLSAPAVSGTFQQNQVYTSAADCSDCLYQERGKVQTKKHANGLAKCRNTWSESLKKTTKK